MGKIKNWIQDIQYWIKELKPLWVILAYALVGFIVSEGLSSLFKHIR